MAPLVVVPKAKIFKNSAEVLSRDSVRKVRIIVGIAYDQQLAAARSTIREAVSGCETVDSDRDRVPYPYLTLTFKKPLEAISGTGKPEDDSGDG